MAKIIQVQEFIIYSLFLFLRFEYVTIIILLLEIIKF